VCYGIVKQAGGYIYVYSEPGQGSTFKVYFPRVALPSEPAGPGAAPAPAAGGTETILLVEDEPAVRALVLRSLGRAGYTVLESEDGEQALEHIEKSGSRIALMLTDVVLPDIDGQELARRIEASLPGTPVIFMSGYTDNLINRNGVLDRGVVFVQKPFTPQTLLGKIRQVLDAAAAKR
jgi:DNA-binding response OmpR family regulator